MTLSSVSGVFISSSDEPAFPPRMPGSYEYFYNRIVVGVDPKNSTFSILHLKNGVDPTDNRHMMWLMQADKNSTQFVLNIFSNETHGTGYSWSYDEPSTQCHKQVLPEGQKQANLKNATYLGTMKLVSIDDVVTLCDVWNGTTPVAGEEQTILWAQKRETGSPFWLHFLNYPTEDSWFVDWSSSENMFVPPLSALSTAQVPSPCALENHFQGHFNRLPACMRMY